MFLAFRICARPISSKKERTFFLAFCPPSVRAGGGTNADSVLRKLFFGERISQNTRLIFFEFGSRKRRRRGLGRNPPLAPLFSFGEIWVGVSADKFFSLPHHPCAEKFKELPLRLIKNLEFDNIVI